MITRKWRKAHTFRCGMDSLKNRVMCMYNLTLEESEKIENEIVDILARQD